MTNTIKKNVDVVGEMVAIIDLADAYGVDATRKAICELQADGYLRIVYLSDLAAYCTIHACDLDQIPESFGSYMGYVARN